MNTAALRALCVGILAIGLCSPAIAAAPFEALMQKVPEGANVLVVINVEQILRSEFARSHDSQRKLAEAFEERAIMIPPDATQFVMAAQYDFEHFTQSWQAAVMGLKTPISFARVTSMKHRPVEQIGGMEALGGAKVFALNLGDRQLGLLAPSNRQQAARWARRVKQGDRSLSSYLSEMGSFADTAGTDIIVAADLTDVLPVAFVADKLRGNEVLKGRNVDIDKLAGIIAGVRGVRLGIKIGAKCNGMFVVDLQDDPAAMADFAKPLLLSVLENAGVMLEEMADWQLKLGKNSIALQGVLSDEGLRRVMGIVELPAESVAMIEPGSAAPPATTPKSASQAGDSLQREASRKYFQALQQQLESLRLQKNAKSMGQIAKWINNTARRIDRMSTLNVDSELADYGGLVASQLRQMVDALQGIGIQSGAREAQIYGGDSYYYDYNVQGARRAVGAEEKAAGATSALDISRLIANESAAMRRKMTDRYKVDF